VSHTASGRGLEVCKVLSSATGEWIFPPKTEGESVRGRQVDAKDAKDRRLRIVLGSNGSGCWYMLRVHLCELSMVRSVGLFDRSDVCSNGEL